MGWKSDPLPLQFRVKIASQLQRAGFAFQPNRGLIYKAGAPEIQQFYVKVLVLSNLNNSILLVPLRRALLKKYYEYEYSIGT